MNRKVAAITFVIVIALGLLTWIRGDGYTFDIRTILPFTDGQEVSVHQWGRVGLLALGAWGLWRLFHRPGPEDEQEQTNEDTQTEDPLPPSDDGGDGQQPN